MKVTRLGLVMIALTALPACVSVPEAQTDEERAYLDAAMAAPLSFGISRAEMIGSIDRAVDWLQEYHSLSCTEEDRKVLKDLAQQHSAALIVSPVRYNIRHLGSHGYRVSIMGNGALTVNVESRHEGGFGLGEAVERNAHILAHYIKTGQLMPKLVFR